MDVYIFRLIIFVVNEHVRKTKKSLFSMFSEEGILNAEGQQTFSVSNGFDLLPFWIILLSEPESYNFLDFLYFFLTSE